MLLTLLFTLGAVALFAILMSVGLLIKGKALEGTCASQSQALYGKGGTCGVCGQAVGSCQTDESVSSKDVESKQALSES